MMNCPRELKQLLKILYNLSGSEVQILYFLCEEKARVSEIADELEKDRSTVQRYLSKLQTTGLVTRESKSKTGERGRYYLYSVPDKNNMKQEIIERLNEWKDERLAVLNDI